MIDHWLRVGYIQGMEILRSDDVDEHTADYVAEQINSLAMQFKWLRKQRGLSQSQLAHLAGVSPQLIGKVEQGGHITLSSLLRIAEPLDVYCCLCHYRSAPPTLAAVPEFEDVREE